MNHVMRTSLVTLGILVVLVGLGYLAHVTNFVGLLVSMHTPPQ